MNILFPLFVVIANWGEPYAITTNRDSAEFICEDLDEIELAERVGNFNWDENSYEPMPRATIQTVRSESEFSSLIGESSYSLVQSLQTKGIYLL